MNMYQRTSRKSGGGGENMMDGGEEGRNIEVKTKMKTKTMKMWSKWKTKEC